MVAMTTKTLNKNYTEIKTAIMAGKLPVVSVTEDGKTDIFIVVALSEAEGEYTVTISDETVFTATTATDTLTNGGS